MDAIETKARRRGRPLNSGEPDDAILQAIEADLQADPALSVRKAIMGRLPDDTISPDSVRRRLERKLRRRRAERAEDKARSDRLQGFWNSGPRKDVAELHSLMREMGMEPPLYAEDIACSADLDRYIEAHRSLYQIVRLNACETAFDHMASSYLRVDRDRGGISLVSGTGSMEVIGPPATERFDERATLIAWEQGTHAVVLSPEEQASWAATDGAYWRMRHDYNTPLWRKLLPLWRKPDLSMTAALTGIAHRNAWEAHLRRLSGKPIDYDGKLSFETRGSVPASAMVPLPERAWRRVRDAARLAWWRYRHRHVIYPRLHGGSMVTPEPGLAVHVCRYHSTVMVDSIGPGSHDIHLAFSRGRHGDTYRWQAEERCEITDRKTGQPADTATAMRMISNLEWAIGQMDRKPWPRRLALGALLLVLAGYVSALA